MSTVKEIQEAIPKLSPREKEELRAWLDEFFEEDLELTDEVKAALDRSRAEIASGQFHTRQPE